MTRKDSDATPSNFCCLQLSILSILRTVGSSCTKGFLASLGVSNSEESWRTFHSLTSFSCLPLSSSIDSSDVNWDCDYRTQFGLENSLKSLDQFWSSELIHFVDLRFQIRVCSSLNVLINGINLYSQDFQVTSTSSWGWHWGISCTIF